MTTTPDWSSFQRLSPRKGKNRAPIHAHHNPESDATERPHGLRAKNGRPDGSLRLRFFATGFSQGYSQIDFVYR